MAISKSLNFSSKIQPEGTEWAKTQARKSRSKVKKMFTHEQRFFTFYYSIPLFLLLLMVILNNFFKALLPSTYIRNSGVWGGWHYFFKMIKQIEVEKIKINEPGKIKKNCRGDSSGHPRLRTTSWNHRVCLSHGQSSRAVSR